MEINLVSDLEKFSLFIFDLDNTIYNEDDYLFLAYSEIAREFSHNVPGYSEKEFYEVLKKIYLSQGREKLFDKFLAEIGVETSFIPKCLDILRNFAPREKMIPYPVIKRVLLHIVGLGKPIYILTNGNPQQQKNKVSNIEWDGLDRSLKFIFANELEPKPSPKGVLHILDLTGVDKKDTIMIGDSETDYNCAMNSGISFLNVSEILSGHELF